MSARELRSAPSALPYPRRALSLWRVSITAHPLASRWFVPDQAQEVLAPSATAARREAVRQAHRHLGVTPTWRHLVDSLDFATAVCVDGDPQPDQEERP
jgi:hypothetical protein